MNVEMFPRLVPTASFTWTFRPLRSGLTLICRDFTRGFLIRRDLLFLSDCFLFLVSIIRQLRCKWNVVVIIYGTDLEAS